MMGNRLGGRVLKRSFIILDLIRREEGGEGCVYGLREGCAAFWVKGWGGSE